MSEKEDSRLVVLDGDVLKCCICKNQPKGPKILPCFHLFCQKCIGEHSLSKQDNNRATCPVCESDFIVPYGGTDDQQNNDLVEKVFKGEKRFRDKSSEACIYCCLEAIQVDAAKSDKSYCMQCEKTLCPVCLVLHKNLNVLQFHSLGEDKTSSRESNYCKEHQEEELTLLCRDCDIPICELCHQKSHSVHNCADVETVAEEYRLHMQEVLDRLIAQQNQTHMKRVEAQRKQLDKMEEIERFINQRGEELKAIVDNDTNKLLMRLEEARTKVNELDCEALAMAMDGEDGSEQNLEAFEVIEALIPNSLTFTATEIDDESINLIGELVVVEAAEDYSDGASEKTDVGAQK